MRYRPSAMKQPARAAWMPTAALCNGSLVRHGTPQRLAVVVLLSLGLASVACDRAIEPYVPGEQPAAPDLTRIFPEGAERPPGSEVAAAPGSAAGAPTAPANRPPSAGEGAPIRGTVTLAPDLEGRLPAGAILFLIARRGDSGPPLAVQRIVDPRLPFEFAIGPEDRMIKQRPFEGPLELSARLDADGNAMTRQPGDLQGTAPGSYDPGAQGVAIVIDEVL